jgi:uncharacterized repeat protein (TIGR01451 family)
MKIQSAPNARSHRLSFNSIIRIGMFVTLIALIGIPLFSSSSASSFRRSLGVRAASTPAAVNVSDRRLLKPETARISDQLFTGNFLSSRALSLPLPQAGESIATYEYPGCTVPKNSFDLGETVCAIVTGAPLGDGERAARRIAWVSPYGAVTQGAVIVSDPQTGSYQIPVTATQTFTDAGGGTNTVDNRGKWRIFISSAADNSFRTETTFTVHDPTKAFVDLHIDQAVTIAESEVTPGSSNVFEIFVNNFGPNAATNVVITDTVPANTESQSITDHGAGFSCGGEDGGVINCTLASLPADATAHLTLNYSVTTGTPAGTTLTNVVTISSSAAPCPGETTCEIQPNDNSSTATARVPTGGGGGTCTLNCSDNINAVANTTEGGQRGTHVTFDAAEASGTCGAITATPASGSFFPVGSTTVSVTSETGGGSCSFIITVEDTGTNPPNITCPANPPDANADSSCSATVSVGTATATGDNVTIFATRSDGKPMYSCDGNGNCTRLSSDAPFAAGITTITWIAHSHDIAGPYTSEEEEEAHRTGAASCTETVTVNDVTPPTITPPANQTGSADATCQFALLDYTTMATVSDNCACASSDESQICDTRTPITITQSPAPGTLVGLGPHTITLTANDGSSNNGGAGNTATAQFTVTVSDTTAPVINCPAAISRSNDPGQCSAVVNPGTATATDNCDTTPTIVGTRSDNQALSAPYPVGSTTITWTATDDANNQSSCTQTITVNDTELPTISCPVSFTLEPTCPTGAVGTYTTPVGADNCPGAITTRTAGLASGSVFPIGNTTVTYSVTDAHGNGPVSCSFTVTVLTPQAVLNNLIAAVNASSLTGTQKNGLVAKLNAALSAINSGQTNVACNKLSEFVNNVQGLISHGDLTAAQGNAWISSANHVRNTIGCTNLPCS